MNELTIRVSFGQALREQLHDCERQLIEHALFASDGKVQMASRRLGINPGHLYRRIKALGVAHRSNATVASAPPDDVTESLMDLEQRLRAREAGER